MPLSSGPLSGSPVAVGARTRRQFTPKSVRLRKQAREWLQDDLAMWSDALNSGPPTTQAIVRKLMSRWLVEPDLAGVRELSAIRELPADEQPEWLALWKNVADMLNRVKPASWLKVELQRPVLILPRGNAGRSHGRH